MSQDGRQMILMMGMMGVCMALMLAVGVYVMRQEGDKTREEMRRGMQEAGVGVQAATKESIEGGVKDGVGQAKGAIEELTGGLIGTLNDIGKPRNGGKDDESQTSKSKDAESESGSGRRRDDSSSTAKPDLKDPAEIVGGVFNVFSEGMKKVDDVIQKKVELDPKEEQELGKEIHESLMKSEKYQFLEDPDQLGRIEDAALPFLSRLIRPELKYTFTIIDDDVINAFSLPGGYIYVHRGLLDFVSSENELTFVIGHEIGHVDLGHCARSYTYAARSRKVTGGLTDVPFLTIYSQYALAFSETFEHEADSYSIKRMKEAGEPTEGAITFNERLLEHEKANGVAVDDRKPQSIPGAIVAGIDGHFRTHPPTQQRIDRLKRIAK